MGDTYIEVIEAYQVDTVARERPCRLAIPSHRTGTIDNKSGIIIPHLSHFQGFVEQEGKGRQAYMFVAGGGHDKDMGI
jgi:hypothetical protein